LLCCGSVSEQTRPNKTTVAENGRASALVIKDRCTPARACAANRTGERLLVDRAHSKTPEPCCYEDERRDFDAIDDARVNLLGGGRPDSNTRITNTVGAPENEGPHAPFPREADRMAACCLGLVRAGGSTRVELEATHRN